MLLHWNSLRFPFAAGQRWQADVMPRALHGTLNPAGFDRQRHYLSQNVVLSATPRGYRQLDPRRTLRQRVIDLTDQYLADHPARPLLLALLFGERGEITAESRTLLRQSGTLHLLAISGLHIALVAVLAHGVWRALALLLPLHWQTPRPALALAVLAARGYAAGGHTAADAARCADGDTVCLMALARVSVYAARCAHAGPVAGTAKRAAAAAIVGLLVVGECGSIVVVLVRPAAAGDRLRRPCCAPLRLLHLQLGLLLLLSPLQLVLFHGISWTAPLANLVAVPLVSLGVMPRRWRGCC